MKQKLQKHLSEEEFADRYLVRLRKYLNSLSHNPSLSEDLAHDALIVVLCRMRAGTISDLDLLDGFVFNTARFLYFGYLRKKSNTHLTNQDFEDRLESMEKSSETALTTARNRTQLESWIDRLKMERDREVLVRSYLYDHPKEQVVFELGLSPQKFDVIMNRAKNRLRACLHQHEYSAMAV